MLLRWEKERVSVTELCCEIAPHKEIHYPETKKEKEREGRVCKSKNIYSRFVAVVLRLECIMEFKYNNILISIYLPSIGLNTNETHDT